MAFNTTQLKGAPSSATSAGGTKTATAALDADPHRKGFYIQNHDTNILYVRLGTGPATASNYHKILKAASSATSGDGGEWAVDGYAGAVSVSATPSYSIVELV